MFCPDANAGVSSSWERERTRKFVMVIYGLEIEPGKCWMWDVSRSWKGGCSGFEEVGGGDWEFGRFYEGLRSRDE